MKVKRLHLQNYGRFENLNIDFAPTAEKTGNVTVIVGNNGAGKSQILQALATSLSWFIARLNEDNAEGKHLTQSVIKNNSNSNRSIVDIKVEALGITKDKGNWQQSSLSASWNIRALKEKSYNQLYTIFKSMVYIISLIVTVMYLVKIKMLAYLF